MLKIRMVLYYILHVLSKWLYQQDWFEWESNIRWGNEDQLHVQQFQGEYVHQVRIIHLMKTLGLYFWNFKVILDIHQSPFTLCGGGGIRELQNLQEPEESDGYSGVDSRQNGKDSWGSVCIPQRRGVFWRNTEKGK